MKKTYFALAGMIISLLVALLGLVILTGTFSETDYPYTAPSTYDSGYATFGADYYNFVCNNTAETASAARTTAYNLQVICDLLTTVSGIFLTGFGLLNLCRFGMTYCDLNPRKKEVSPVNQPTSDTPAEPPTHELSEETQESTET